MEIVNESSICDAYLKLINLVYTEGGKVKDERGSQTREVLNIVTHVKEPVPFNQFHVNVPIYQYVNTPKGTFWNGERLEKYCKEFTSCDRNGFVYTYGNRLGEWFGVDQIAVAIDRLKNCSESRRAISVTWCPDCDASSDEVPCMILVDFKIRKGKLITTALWRSHDIYGAWFANIVGLTYLAQTVASAVGVDVGEMTIQSISGHIYETDIDEVEKMLKAEGIL